MIIINNKERGCMEEFFNRACPPYQSTTASVHSCFCPSKSNLLKGVDLRQSHFWVEAAP